MKKFTKRNAEPMPGDADCIECRGNIAEGTLAVHVSSVYDVNGEGWQHWPSCAPLCLCGHESANHIPVQSGPHHATNGPCGHARCECCRYVPVGQTAEQEFFDHLSAAYRVWVYGQDLETGSAEELLARNDLTPYQVKWLGLFNEFWHLTEHHRVGIVPDCFCCGEPAPDYQTMIDKYQEAGCAACVAKLIAEGRYIATPEGPKLAEGWQEPEPFCYEKRLDWADLGRRLRQAANDAAGETVNPRDVREAYGFLLENPEAFGSDAWPAAMPQEPNIELVAAYYGRI